MSFPLQRAVEEGSPMKLDKATKSPAIEAFGQLPRIYGGCFPNSLMLNPPPRGASGHRQPAG
jgi:hypothetical protein